MKFPISWLREYANPQLSDAQLAHQLTMAGLEIEAIENFGSNDDNLIIAEILSVEKHPSADKLNICKVKADGDEILNIVCGANNVRVGLKTVLAKIGAKIGVKDKQIEIKPATLRGVESNGMLCSAEELELIGLEDIYTGILELPDGAPVGKKIKKYLPVSDTIFTVKLTPNRGDCLSIIGLAREVGALTNTLVKPLQVNQNLFENPQHTDKVVVVIDDNAKNDCLHYYGRVVNNINPQAKTPLLIQLRLVQCGERSIHPLVDITNYVMLETGKPTHAFDRKKCGQIGVQFFDEKIHESKFKLLNGEECSFNSECLLITNDNKPTAVAGVMGGMQSAINIDEPELASDSVFFESAHFTPSVIQGRTKLLGLNSQSAYRFERGVDSKMTEFALNRACELASQICAGKIGDLCFAGTHKSENNPKIKLSLDKARKLIGYPYTSTEAENTLTKLGFKVDKISDDVFEVQSPSWRFDVMVQEDLIEEIARIVGYDCVEEDMPIEKVMMSSADNKKNWINIAENVAKKSFQEINAFGFVSQKTDKIFNLAKQYQPIVLSNPIAENLNVMRGQLIGSLVENCAVQVRNQQKNLRIFEIARVFNLNKNTSVKDVVTGQLGTYSQPYHLAMLMWGELYPMQWAVQKKTVNYFDLKGILTNLFTDVEFVFEKFSDDEMPSFLHPARSSNIIIAGKVVGFIGECHPKIVNQFNLSSPAILLECDLDNLNNFQTYSYKAITRLPIIERDLSLLIPKNSENEISATQIIDDINNQNFQLIKNIVVFDVYSGSSGSTNQIPDNKKNLALRFSLQGSEKNLGEEEINSQIQLIIERLKSEWGIDLR